MIRQIVFAIRSIGARPVTLRLDPDVLEKFRATGPGWRSRMNEALHRAQV